MGGRRQKTSANPIECESIESSRRRRCRSRECVQTRAQRAPRVSSCLAPRRFNCSFAGAVRCEAGGLTRAEQDARELKKATSIQNLFEVCRCLKRLVKSFDGQMGFCRSLKFEGPTSRAPLNQQLSSTWSARACVSQIIISWSTAKERSANCCTLVDGGWVRKKVLGRPARVVWCLGSGGMAWGWDGMDV